MCSDSSVSHISEGSFPKYYVPSSKFCLCDTRIHAAVPTSLFQNNFSGLRFVVVVLSFTCQVRHFGHSLGLGYFVVFSGVGMGES